MDIRLNTNGKLSTPPTDWAGYTTKRNLAAIRQIDPKFGSKLMTYIGMANSSAMAYEEYLKMITDVKFRETDDDLNYMVFGDGRKFVTLKKVIADDMNKIGFNKATFIAVFDAPLFSEAHVIIGMSDRYRIRVMDDGREAYGGWAYECTTFGPASDFIPASEMKAGTTWTKEGAPMALYNSEKGVKTSYTSPYSLTFTWSSVSIEDKVPGNMKHRPVAFGWLSDEGKLMTTWEYYRTYKNDMEFRELKNRTLIWGRSNMNEAGGYDDIDPRSGVEIVYGSGSMEQIERGNVRYYNEFDVEELGDYIMKMRRGKNQTDKLHYVVRTGSDGMTTAARDIANKAREWEKVDSKSIFGDQMNAGFGLRFTRYLHPAGFYIDFRYEPLFDEMERTPVRMPNGGYARSSEFHITDAGQTQGENSIELNYVKSMADNTVIVKGMRSPYSLEGKGVTYDAASTTDAWIERRMSQFMFVNRNPRNSLIYRPNILR